jgi:hypothetical protein
MNETAPEGGCVVGRPDTKKPAPGVLRRWLVAGWRSTRPPETHSTVLPPYTVCLGCRPVRMILYRGFPESTFADILAASLFLTLINGAPGIYGLVSGL